MFKNTLSIWLAYLALSSCIQNTNKKSCEGFINGEFRGNAIILFHKPISGSTYQVFLIPVCNLDTLTSLSELSSTNKIASGISFSITSDDERFRFIKDKSQSFFLKGRDHLGENFRHIYYSLVETKIVLSEDVMGFDNKEEMKIILESGNEMEFKYNYVSSLRLKKFEVGVLE